VKQWKPWSNCVCGPFIVHSSSRLAIYWDPRFALSEIPYLSQIVIKKLTSLTLHTNNTEKAEIVSLPMTNGSGGIRQSLLNEIFVHAKRLKCHIPYFSFLICQWFLQFNSYTIVPDFT
jgi:hypothetical protein